MAKSNKKKLLWRSRRGMLELDLMLQPYIQAHFEGLSAKELAVIEEFLSEPDPQIYAMLLGVLAPTKPEYEPLCQAIANHAESTA